MSSKIAILRPSGDELSPPPKVLELLKGTRDMSENHVLIDEGYDLIGEALSAYLGAPVVAVTLTDKIKERNN
jgi:hypothetical protein